jgi:hypothetical protein
METEKKPSVSEQKFIIQEENPQNQVSADEDWRIYLKERESLVNAILEQSKSFDKYVLTLASGAFGLSLLFIKDAVSKPLTTTIPFLTASWTLFSISIALTLLSFLLSQEACKAQIEIDKKVLVTNEFDNVPTNIFSVITYLLNWLSGSSFIAGIITLAIFGIKNINLGV